MATVYDAEHVHTGAPAALKILDVDLGRQPDLRRRFEREVRVMARVVDPHVPRVLDVGEVRRRPYLAMERVDGETLAARLDRGPVSIGEVYTLAEDLLVAVAAVHRHDVVHRDIKPSNVLLTRADGPPRLVLLDFGICLSRRADDRISAADLVAGTPSWAAPELLRGEEPDARADLYSVGAVLYECLTGVPPATGDTWAQVARTVLEEEPIAPSALRPDCPASLERLVLLSLARDPGRRFQSAMEMRGALDDVRSGEEPVRAVERASRIDVARPATWGERVEWRVLVLTAFAVAAIATMLVLLT